MPIDDFAEQLAAIQNRDGDKLLQFFHLLLMKKPLDKPLELSQLSYPSWLLETLRANSLDIDSSILSSQEQVYFQIASKFIDFLSKYLQLAPAIHSTLEQHKALLLAHLLEAPELMLSPDSALAYFVNTLSKFAAGWFEGLEKSPQALLKRCQNLIAISAECGYETARVEAQQAEQKYEQETLKAERLANRLLDSESGKARVRRAEHMVITLLNDTIAGSSLPPDLLAFLQGPWLDELRLLLIREGVESKLWLSWKRLLGTLAWVFKEDMNEQETQRLYQISPSLVQEFEASLKQVNPNASEQFNSVLNELEQAQICLLKKTRPELIKAQRLNRPDEREDISTTVSRQLIEKIHTLEVRQWFSFNTEQGHNIRCQLIAHLPDSSQLLFINYYGQKALLKDAADLAACWSLKLLQAIPSGNIYDKAFNEFLLTYKESYLNQAKAYLEQENLALEVAKAKKQQRQQEILRQQESEERAKVAAEETRKQAQALALKRQQEEETLKLKLQQEAEVKAVQEAREKSRMMKLLVDSINIGAWLELPDKNQQLVKAKLAVKMNSTRKFIFVDGVGVKVAEYIREELIDLFMNGQANLLEQSSKFEDRLAQVVRGLRKE